ncbi:MAG: gamma-glutamylcyclotransferase [Candidatus Eremiobacteraeota bacterium]|nr:gamma-glutamylcyclotransferase [Candidatus Eremiobacteraeota bacterium]MBV8366258.1 gamma-glutamylcyclotransferase [Candidatus Eremiobacteraeota bacterium]
MAAPAADTTDLVFVYGLLKRGFSLHHHMSLGVFIGSATVAGKLYSLGHYPGLVEGTGKVHGEVYRFADVAVALEVLDEVEGYDPLNPDESEYLRVVKLAEMDAKSARPSVWCYVHNAPIAGRTLIQSGTWSQRT